MSKSSRSILTGRRAALQEQWNQNQAGWPTSRHGRIWFTLTMSAAGLLLLHHIFGTWSGVAALLVSLLIAGKIALAADCRRLRRLAADRAGESICTFSRSFPKASRNPLLIRAVYASLHQDYYQNSAPVRTTDRLEKEFRMDDEELDDLLVDLAALTGRCLKQTESNPLWGKVTTAGDIVSFLQHQPILTGGIFG